MLARSYTFITVSGDAPDVFLEKSYAFFVPSRVGGDIKLCVAVNMKNTSLANVDLGQAVADLRELEVEYGDAFSEFISERSAIISLESGAGFRLAPA